ncbi:Ltp family lipoprotein [Arthrobacter sp. NtRootA1]|uniref:Ltp family lipoprotein n=1 Tax=Arthrobacter sp. NtRootA1 TaxID=2830983 RepID=UPI001CC5706D|nr:Ltp family lipoprotein [Arthrobacter sp. NtRootA1]BCW04965.1 hypothetical protein NtRootA1_11030 [Arthrobacter sp. NtRootA1]
MSDTTPPDGRTNPAAPVPPEGPAAPGTKPKKEKRKAGLGTWARALGVIGIIFAFTPAAGFGIFLGVVALVLGIIGLLRKARAARAGVILGALALILGIIFVNVYSSRSSSSPAPAASPTGSSSAPAAAPAPAVTSSGPSGTAAQMQALAAAKGYLASGIGFSEASLTKQLTSSAGNGFPQADAQWAVDNSGADWNAEAVKAAKGYLASGIGFSEASLTKQLTSSAGNQFTQPQAEYAVANSGADWNAEAVKAAKGYMSSGLGFSRQSLIAQLTSPAGNQFTAPQAEYAADQVGLK